MKASELLLQSASPFDQACIMVREMEVELYNLRNVAQAADELLMATLGTDGEIDTTHPKTQILLDALYAWRPLFAEVSNE